MMLMSSVCLYNRVVGWARRSPATFFMHLAFIVIIVGALFTFFGGYHGQIRLENGVSGNCALDGAELPFSLTLNNTRVDYYPASTAPRSYACSLSFAGLPTAAAVGEVAMNKPLVIDGYRFTLVSIAGDSAVLAVNHDPAGIAVSYAGYALLILSMIAFFFQRKSGFRALLRSMRRVGVRSALLLMLFCFQAFAASAQKTADELIPDDVARTFGKIYVYWDDRPVPVQTMSRSILSRVYGSDSYDGLSADQVVLGWIAFYDQWKTQPIFKIKSRRVRDLLGIEGKYASLADFFSRDGYKLQPALNSPDADDELRRVDANVQLITSLAAGSLMRVFPYMSANDRMEWLSWTDYKPSRMSLGQWDVVSNSMGKVVKWLYAGDSARARKELLSIRQYQIQTAEQAGNPLSQSKFRAEILYNKIASPLVPAISLCAVSILVLGLILLGMTSRWADAALAVVAGAGWLWLTSVIALRWVIAGHTPLSNGPESMETMAWVALSGCLLIFGRRRELASFAMMAAGLSLAVAAMSGSASSITPLMPVLNSPLLSVHVFVIMASYALFTIMTLVSLAVLLTRRREDSMRLWRFSLCMLYPAEFLLAAGIFIGAVWANQSWGRYWGWDPKETWALITLIVYSAPLHWRRLRWCRSPRKLAIYLLLGFLCVLITYFGVNFFLGGLHSYAG